MSLKSKKYLALTVLGTMVFNTIVSSSVLAADAQVSGSASVSVQQDNLVEKAKQLGILKKPDAKPATLVDVIIAALREKMLLDYRVGLAVTGEKITGNPNIDAYLNTASMLFDVKIDKNNLFKPVSKEVVATLVKKIDGVDIPASELPDQITKKDLAIVLVKAYDKKVEEKFNELEGKTEQQGQTGQTENNQENNQQQANDILGEALGDLLGDLGNTNNQEQQTQQEQGTEQNTNNVEMVSSETENTQATTEQKQVQVNVKIASPTELLIETNADVNTVTITDENGNEIKISKVEKTGEKTYKVELADSLLNVKSIDVKITNKEGDSYDKKIDVVFNKDLYVKELNNNIVSGYNNVAEVTVVKPTTIKVTINGIFDFDDVGNIYITDSNLEEIYSRKIRQGETIERQVKPGTYYVIIENKTASGSTMNIDVNGTVIDAKLFDLKLGDVNMAFTAEAGSNRTITSNDTVKLVWTAQNVGDEPVVLKKFTLKTDGSAEISDVEKNVKIGIYNNNTCEANNNYKVSEDGNKLIFVLNGNPDQGIGLDVTETKKICVSITGIYGDEGDYIQIDTDPTDDLGVLFSVKKYPGIYGHTTISELPEGYGRFEIKSASILFSQASDVSVKIPVGDNVPVYKWDVQVLGQDVQTDTFKIQVKDLTGNFPENSFDNAKLIFIPDGSNTEKIIDIDTNPVISGDVLTLSFRNTVDIPVGSGKFMIRADLGGDLDGHKLQVTINKEDVVFENKDGDDVYPVTSLTSPELLVLKADVDFTSSVKTINGLVNTENIIGTFTISNLGGTDVTISKVDLEENPSDTVKGKFSLLGIGLAPDTNDTDNISLDNVDMITDFENVLGKTSQSFAITKTVTIPAGKTKTFVVVGKIDGTGLNGNEQMQWQIPKKGITLVTQYGSSLTNQSPLMLDIVITKLHGKATLVLNSDVEDSKIKSPSDKYVSLGRLSVEAKYEDLRLNKLTIEGFHDDGQPGFIDLDKIYVVKTDNDKCPVEDFKTDNIKGVGIVGTDPDVVISMNEIVKASTDVNQSSVTNYCIYGKLLTNDTGFKKGNLYIKLADADQIEIYGVKTGNLYDSSSLSISGQGRTVNFYPAVLAFNPESNNPVTTAGDNKQLLLFNLTNKDDKNIKVKNIKFQITTNPQIIIRNFKLVDSVTDDVIATTPFYTEKDGNYYIEFNNINYMLNKYYSKDIKLIADVYTLGAGDTGIDGQISLTVNLGNPDDANSATTSSFDYVAVEDDGTEIPFSDTMPDVWFVKTDASNINNYSWTDVVVDFNDIASDATCTTLVDPANLKADFSYDATDNKYIGKITLAFTPDATDEEKKELLNRVTLSLEDPGIDSIENITKDYSNYTITFNYNLSPAGFDAFKNDIPLLGADKIKINTLFNDCYIKTNSSDSTDYSITRANSSENIVVETDPTKNGMTAIINNSGTANNGKIEAGDSIVINVHDRDNKANALYDLLGDIDKTDATVAVDSPDNLGIEEGDTTKDTIVVNGNIALRFNTSNDLAITDGGDGNNPTATVKFNADNLYDLEITIINSDDDDTIGDLDDSTSQIIVYVKDSDGNWHEIGTVPYNGEY